MRTLLLNSLFIFVSLSVSPNANAAWRDWWQRADQQGFALLNKGKAERASEVFSDPQWRGIARFNAGQYGQAGGEFAKSSTPDALYNRATALAHAGELKQSLAAFDWLLAQQATHEDGIANRDWVLRQLERQQAQQGEQQNQQQQGGQGAESNQQQSHSGQSARQNPGQSAQQQAGDKPESGDDKTHDDKTQNANNARQTEQQAAEQALKSALQERQPDQQQAKEQSAGVQQSAGPEQQIGDEQQEAIAAMQKQPYDEATQAIEQQLQRLPDDPAILLRNKLYVTHQSRYANVREGDQPW